MNNNASNNPPEGEGGTMKYVVLKRDGRWTVSQVPVSSLPLLWAEGLLLGEGLGLSDPYALAAVAAHANMVLEGRIGK